MTELKELKELIEKFIVELSRVDAQQDEELSAQFARVCAEISNSTNDRKLEKALDEAFRI